jgi:hypothetical protein
MTLPKPLSRRADDSVFVEAFRTADVDDDDLMLSMREERNNWVLVEIPTRVPETRDTLERSVMDGSPQLVMAPFN